MANDKARGILVCPCWKSSLFWTFLCINGVFIDEVVDWFDLPIEKHFYVKCKNGKGMFGNTDLKFRMLALQFDFRKGN